MIVYVGHGSVSGGCYSVQFIKVIGKEKHQRKNEKKKKSNRLQTMCLRSYLNPLQAGQKIHKTRQQNYGIHVGTQMKYRAVKVYHEKVHCCNIEIEYITSGDSLY